VFVATGARTVIGTHPTMVRALAAGAEAVPVPPGAVASVHGDVRNVAMINVCEKLALVGLSALEKEIAHHLRGVGRSRHTPSELLADITSPMSLMITNDGLVALPRIASLAREGALDTLRREIGQLWWRSSLRNTRLFVPALERPALDTLTLAMNANS
jgi:hypothetical protein